VSSNNSGATNWPPQAFSPDTGLLYVPVAENYAMYYLTELDPPGAMGLGGKGEISVGGVGNYIVAIDYKTGKAVWKHGFLAANDGPRSPGLLTTAGRRLFAGDVSGNFISLMVASMCWLRQAIVCIRLRCIDVSAHAEACALRLLTAT
jgi:alcohol dehydrogenase (cytochrome c)